MKCKYCNCEIEGKTTICPLCHEKLEHPNEEILLFPKKITQKRKPSFSIFTKLYWSISIPLFLIMLVINLTVAKEYLWSIFSAVLIIYAFVIVQNIIQQNKAITIKFFWQMIFIIIIFVSVQTIFKLNGDITEFSVPTIICLSVLILHIVGYSTRKKDQDILFSVLLFSSLGTVPLICVGLKILNKLWPSFICFFICLLFSIFTFILFHREIISTFKKKMHI